MSAQGDRKKWCICQVHQPGFPDEQYYTRLPQYGPWDQEREASTSQRLALGRLEDQAFALTVGECADDPRLTSVPQIDSITAIDETSLPDQHDTKRKYYEEPLRWQSRVQHD
jgi:hypothetical protein